MPATKTTRRTRRPQAERQEEPALPELEAALALLDPLVARRGRGDWKAAAGSAFARHLHLSYVGATSAKGRHSHAVHLARIEEVTGPLPPARRDELLAALARVGQELHLLAEAEDRAAEALWDAAVHGVPPGRGLRGTLRAARKRVELVQEASNAVEGCTTWVE